jgi:hypothetical protein
MKETDVPRAELANAGVAIPRVVAWVRDVASQCLADLGDPSRTAVSCQAVEPPVHRPLQATARQVEQHNRGERRGIRRPKLYEPGWSGLWLRRMARVRLS